MHQDSFGDPLEHAPGMLRYSKYDELECCSTANRSTDVRSPLAKRPRLEQLNIHFLDVLSAIPDFGGRLAQYLWSTRETQFQDPLWKLSGMQEGINGKPILITSHLPRLLCASSAMQLSLVVGIKERRSVSLKEGSLKLQT